MSDSEESIIDNGNINDLLNKAEHLLSEKKVPKSVIPSTGRPIGRPKKTIVESETDDDDDEEEDDDDDETNNESLIQYLHKECENCYNKYIEGDRTQKKTCKRFLDQLFKLGAINKKQYNEVLILFYTKQ